MKYYTESIRPTLAEKLKEKGMPMTSIENFAGTGKDIDLAPTYAEVFDWLMSRGINISICHRKTSIGIEWYPMVNGECPRAIDGKEWQHSAEKAIEKALELI